MIIYENKQVTGYCLEWQNKSVDFSMVILTAPYAALQPDSLEDSE